jgi:hypothetical protein
MCPVALMFQNAEVPILDLNTPAFSQAAALVYSEFLKFELGES